MAAPYSWKALAKQWLVEDLEVDEVSLVDKGANRYARVALTKRDDGGDVELMPRSNPGSGFTARPGEKLKRRKEGRMPKRKLEDLLEEVAKLDSPGALARVQKADIVEAVIEKANRRALANGTNPALEESKIWNQIYSQPRPAVDYELNPAQAVVKRFAACDAEADKAEAASCPNCAEPTSPGQHYCSYCGSALSDTAKRRKRRAA